MKAWVLHDIGDIRYEEREIPVPAAGEVLLEVGAVGVCGSDIPRIYQTGAHKMPLIPGHEFSGKVVMPDETSGGADAGSTVGGPTADDAGTRRSADKWYNKRVGVFPLIPCRKCGPCQKGLYEMCRSYDYVGSRRDGAFAEYVCVPVDNLIELPDEVSYEEAAMLEPMAVGVHAMRRGVADYLSVEGIQAAGGEATSDTSTIKCKQPTIAVCGLGTIGLLLTMFLVDAGFTDIYIMGNKNFQKEKALQLGIKEDHYIDSRSDKDKLTELTGGIDVFYECVGKNETVSLAVDMAAPAGTVVMVGNPASDMTFDRDVYWKILRNQLKVTGTWNSSWRFSDEQETAGSTDAENAMNDAPETKGNGQQLHTMDDWHYVLDRLKAGSIRPAELITHSLKLEELEQGFTVMRDKTEDYCKVMATLYGT